MPDLKYTRGDDRAAAELLTAAAFALEARGRTLWTPTALTPERLGKHYPAPSWRVAWRDGNAVGCYALLDSDPTFWPGDPPGEALYLHKLAVHPDAQGRGLGHALLREAVRETRGAGRRWLKLDTATDRAPLRALYEAFGFQAVGRRTVLGYDVTLYELEVVQMAPPAHAPDAR